MAAYATLEMLKTSMQKTDDDDDVVLLRILDGAERKINRFCNRPDGFLAVEDASARYYKGSGKAYQLIDECVEITEVAVKDAWSDEDYTAWSAPSANMAGDGDWFAGTGDPDDPDFNSLPYTLVFVDPNGEQSWFTGEELWQKKRGRNARGSSLLARTPTVRVTARWGYSDLVPDDIRQATIMLSARWYKRLQGAMADSLASADLGGLMYVAQLDPDIAGILLDGRYVRPAIGRRQ